ncbi:VOC family protein [Alteraurantiacibacter buctensis]|uniref:VOC family protein n=1 Tax=Alteraurantiacibacter buctensis TaxID=1503981 RepID=A0A844YTK5_9SPHN|nr:VOC family protein [Alteraurantiacibacter buctensis]MXO70201.1 VOC family protein [Alteraurantiacibacter buctensis]
MFNHMFVGTNDIDASRKFYDATMGALGYAGHPLPHGTVYPSENGSFIVAKPANGEAATCMNGITIGFKAASYDQVDAWHAAGLANGGEDLGAPGFRAQSPGNMYGAYLRDPDGHKICVFTANVGDR